MKGKPKLSCARICNPTTATIESWDTMNKSSLSRRSLSRRSFLKASALAGVGASLAGASKAAAPLAPSSALTSVAEISQTRPRPAGQKPVHELTTKPRARVRVAVIGLHRGMAHVHACLGIEFAEVVAVCDLVPARADQAAEVCEKNRGHRPAVYGGTENIWEQMVEREVIDAVYIATPWRWHVPMALRTMERGKSAFIEVAAALTVDDCWALVDTSERTQQHCVLLENCCYGEDELFVLNLAREGVFGRLTHAECAYLHDLRGVLFSLGSEGDWRRDYHEHLNGNLYPTHGLGPVAQYLGVGRGDQFKFLVSTSSAEISLTEYRDQHQPDSVVYDAAAWSCFIELSVRSVSTGSLPVNIPDFTRGLWKTMPPLGIAEKA